MANKKSLEQLQAAAIKAELRAKEIRKQIAAQTKAEEAKHRAKVLEKLLEMAKAREMEPEEYLETAAHYFDECREVARMYSCKPEELLGYIRQHAPEHDPEE